MLIPILILVSAVLMGIIERLFPGRVLPEVRGWRIRSTLLNACHAVVVVGGGFWLQPWLESIRPWSADGLGTVGGATLGYLVATFIYYWWHRARHEIPWLWRTLHQVHHSAQRLEVQTSFYKHPLEAATNMLFGGFILYVVCGLDPEVAQWTVLVNAIAEFFYHWNVKTPRWIGWIIQRPEAHCAHHDPNQRCNYADLPVWDALFGTLNNPRETEFVCGIEDENRLATMLIGVDLDAPHRPRSSLFYKGIAAGLVAVGTLQMIGDISGSSTLFGLGLATAASPAPKVFTSRDQLEGFSANYVLTWEENGNTQEVPLDAEVYAHLKGPYNRRNVYGAALAGGPVLLNNPATQPLFDAVSQSAFCGKESVLSELGVDTSAAAGPLRIRVEPRAGHPTPEVPLILEIACR